MATIQTPLASRRQVGGPLATGPGTGLTRYTLTLQPDATDGIDTYIRSAAPDTNYGNLNVFIIATARPGLIKFSGLSAIPAGAVVVSAALSLTVSGASSTTGQILTLSRILIANTAWTELGATWNYTLASTVRWAGDVGADGGADAGCSVSGTDYSATPLATVTYTNNNIGDIYNISLSTAEVSLMLANNCGLVISSNGVFAVNFATSDHATASYWPKLVVVYDA